MEQYPENVQKEEPTKQLLSQIYKELGAISYKVQKEKQVDVYLPRIDLFTILRPEQISCFDGTAFEYLREIVCFEVHTSSLDEETFVKWYIELLGLYLMLAKDLKFQYQNFTGFSLLEHVPRNFLKTIPQEILVSFDPFDKQKPCLIKIEGFIPWFFVLKPHLRYDFFCLPINLMLPERHAELIPMLKQQKYHEHRILEEMAFKVLDWFYKKKGAPTMLDIASILEKSDDPSFVHFRKCRDMLLEQGKIEGEIKGKIEGEIKGKIEGEIKGKIEGLGMLLQVRFGEMGLQLMPKIRSIQNLDKLNFLLPLAMNAQNIEEFEHGLASCL